MIRFVYRWKVGLDRRVYEKRRLVSRNEKVFQFDVEADLIVMHRGVKWNRVRMYVMNIRAYRKKKIRTKNCT